MVKSLLSKNKRLPTLEPLVPADKIDTLLVVLFKLTLPEPDKRSLLEIMLPVKLPLDPSITLPEALIVNILVPEVVTVALISMFEVD